MNQDELGHVHSTSTTDKSNIINVAFVFLFPSLSYDFLVTMYRCWPCFFFFEEYFCINKLINQAYKSLLEDPATCLWMLRLSLF